MTFGTRSGLRPRALIFRTVLCNELSKNHITEYSKEPLCGSAEPGDLPCVLTSTASPAARGATVFHLPQRLTFVVLWRTIVYMRADDHGNFNRSSGEATNSTAGSCPTEALFRCQN
jgi:hypothetical protein